jgi:hypothetical protein
LLSAVFVLVIKPAPYIDPTQNAPRKSSHHVRKTVKFIQDLGITGKVSLL